MINFLIKGLFRDRSRSLFPILITASGVALTVLASAWMIGIMGQMFETVAKFQTGHVSVKTRAFVDQIQPNPLELAIMDADKWLKILNQDYPQFNWKYRITFGGLLDIPNDKGETVSQAPVLGMSMDLLSKDGLELENLNLRKSLTKGSIPKQPGEILISDALFVKLDLKLGQTATLISSDIHSAMAVYNFKIVGTVVFGVHALDRGAIVADVTDIQMAFDMENTTTEIFGFYKTGGLQIENALQIQRDFNQKYTKSDDIYSLVMMTLKDDELMGMYVDVAGYAIYIMIIVFIFIISIVLWNAGLMSGIRRYGEIGIRLAIGESKNHLYISLIIESVVIGFGGFVLGTVIGLIPAYLLQIYGLDMGNMMRSGDMVFPNEVRAEITHQTFWIGLIPGVAAPFMGAVLSGLVIYKRQTAQLFKELEV